MKIIDLNRPNLRKVPVKTKVITTKGFIFQLVKRSKGKESWKDLKSGITWHDVENKKYSWNEAVETFADRLPTKEEFIEAEEHGFGEVLPYPINNWFWSSSPNYDGAWYFSGYYGEVNYGFRGNHNSVRCVGR